MSSPSRQKQPKARKPKAEPAPRQRRGNKPTALRVPTSAQPALPRSLRGSGDYYDVVGDAVAKHIVAPAIDWGVKQVRNGLSSLWDTITGSGSYRVKHNSLVHDSQGKSISRGPPMFSNGNRSIVISHREFVGKVRSSASFVATYHRINPGDSVLFPLTHSIAQCFEQFKIHGMVLEYKSMSTTYSATVGLGTVMMATSYNPTRAPYASRAELLNEYFAVDGKSSDNFIHPIECAPKETPVEELLVRAQGTRVVDPSLYDMGVFCIATEGGPVQDVGELWISYEIEFFKPRFQNASQQVIGTDRYKADLGGLSPREPEFAATLTKCEGSSLNTSLHHFFYTENGGDFGTAVLFPKAGRYYVRYSFVCADTITPVGFSGALEGFYDLHEPPAAIDVLVSSVAFFEGDPTVGTSYLRTSQGLCTSNEAGTGRYNTVERVIDVKADNVYIGLSYWSTALIEAEPNNQWSLLVTSIPTTLSLDPIEDAATTLSSLKRQIAALQQRVKQSEFISVPEPSLASSPSTLDLASRILASARK